MTKVIGRKAKFKNKNTGEYIHGVITVIRDDNRVTIKEDVTEINYHVPFEEVLILATNPENVLLVCPKCKSFHEAFKWNDRTSFEVSLGRTIEIKPILPIEIGITSNDPTRFYCCPDCGVKAFPSAIKVIETAPKIRDLKKLVTIAMGGVATKDDMYIVLALITAFPQMPIEDVLETLYYGTYDYMVEGDNWGALVDEFIDKNFIGFPEELIKVINRDLVLAMLKKEFIETPFGFIKLESD